MSNILKAISEDIEEYIYLCKKYGEKVQYVDYGEDCYGEHASKLKQRQREEWAAKRANVPTVS
jgi:hypothetical protein